MRVRALSHQVEFVGSFPGELPDTQRIEVAFVGRSNVGKSSALNTILGSKVARVSATPGRTQTVNLFLVDAGYCFADLPGYGFAKVPEHVRVEWGRLVDRYLTTRRALELVFVLVDHRHAAQKLDLEMLERLRVAEIPFVVVATKVDKLTRNARGKARRVLEAGLGVKVVPFSSEDGEGVNEVWKKIGELAAAR